MFSKTVTGANSFSTIRTFQDHSKWSGVLLVESSVTAGSLVELQLKDYSATGSDWVPFVRIATADGVRCKTFNLSLKAFQLRAGVSTYATGDGTPTVRFSCDSDD